MVQATFPPLKSSSSAPHPRPFHGTPAARASPAALRLATRSGHAFPTSHDGLAAMQVCAAEPSRGGRPRRSLARFASAPVLGMALARPDSPLGFVRAASSAPALDLEPRPPVLSRKRALSNPWLVTGGCDDPDVEASMAGDWDSPSSAALCFCPPAKKHRGLTPPPMLAMEVALPRMTPAAEVSPAFRRTPTPPFSPPSLVHKHLRRLVREDAAPVFESAVPRHRGAPAKATAASARAPPLATRCPTWWMCYELALRIRDLVGSTDQAFAAVVRSWSPVLNSWLTEQQSRLKAHTLSPTEISLLEELDLIDSECE